MIIGPVFGTLIALAVGLRLYFLATRERVPRGPNLHARMERLFEPSLGRQLTPALVSALEADANALFRDILTGVGLIPNEWHVLVQMDDVLGPVPRVCGPSGELMHVADFEQRLRDGKIELPSS